MALIATAATLRLPKVTKAQPEIIFGYTKGSLVDPDFLGSVDPDPNLGRAGRNER